MFEPTEQMMPLEGVLRQPVEAAPVAALPSAASRLRIAIVSDAISGRNGVGTYYPDLINHIAPHVNDVQLIAPQMEPDRSIEAFSLPMPGDSTQHLAWPRRRALYAKLDEIRPDVLILPSIGPFSYFALRYARKRNLPMAIVNHTNFDHLLSVYWSNWVSWPLRRVLGGLNWWLCRQATSIAAMNVEAQEQAQHAGAKLVRVMGTPLDKTFLDAPIRPVPDKVTKAIFVGRLAREKGVDRLLETVRELPDIQFTIAGDGPLKETVEQAAAECENLSYLGWLPRPRVREEIDASEILLLPSAYETFGTVALEALARRRFVVASTHCGISKWGSIAEGIFQTTDTIGLTEVISQIRDMPGAQRNQYAEKSWEAVRAFNDQSIHTWLDFLVDTSDSE